MQIFNVKTLVKKCLFKRTSTPPPKMHIYAKFMHICKKYASFMQNKKVFIYKCLCIKYLDRFI